MVGAREKTTDDRGGSHDPRTNHDEGHDMPDEMTYAEGRAMLDEQTRAKLGVSIDDFLARLDAGEYREDEDMEVVRLAMLVPFARPQSSEGNDGLTDDERRSYAMRHRAGAGRKTSGPSALAALARLREQRKQEG